jgi:hypothetical protein
VERITAVRGYQVNRDFLQQRIQQQYFFVSPRSGKSIKHASAAKDLPPREDIRFWNATTDQAEFDQVINIPADLEHNICNELVSLIQDNLDCFYALGVNCPVRGFEFHINTGSAQPVAC